MRSANAWDTTIAIVTPENIAFDYELAGPFRRVPAYAIDVVVRWSMILLIGSVLSLIALACGLTIGLQGIGGLLVATLLLAYFLISWFYGTFMEAYYNGRTVGKWATGLRVISVDGRPINGTQAMLRNLLRIADMAPIISIGFFLEDFPPLFAVPTCVIGAVSMICTERMQRVGDLAAGTMVVIDERAWRLPLSKVEDPRVPALASFIPRNYRVTRGMAKTLAIYCERRAYLTPARRREIALHLTQPLVEQFEFRPDIDPDLLMVALYHYTFLFDLKVDLDTLGPYAQVSPFARDANQSSPEMSKQGPLTPSVPDVITAEVIAQPDLSPVAPENRGTSIEVSEVQL